MKLIKTLIITLVIILNTGCATLFTGFKDKVYIYVEPENADVYINDKKIGTAPNEFKIGRTYKKKNVTIKKEGYKDVEFVMTKTINPITFINFVGLYGFAVDIATANIFKNAKPYYDFDMEPIEKETVSKKLSSHTPSSNE